ncbi:MAG: PDZ domain-containing protein [Acidobacteria bacterium]|nr:PDZ domain-containing protein [Acidobacteriota bacterium]
MRPIVHLPSARLLAAGTALVFVLTGGFQAAASAQAARSPRADLRSLFGGEPEIGVSIRDVTPAESEREKLARVAGAYVEDVRSGGPADKAGIRSGDVVVAFDGERVRSARQLARVIEETPAGREVDATISRAGRQVALKVTPETGGVFVGGGRVVVPDVEMRGGWPQDRPFGGFGANAGRLGVTVQELTDQLGDFFGARAGVLVTSVATGTPAEAAGLKAGDVITRVNGTAISSASDLRRSIAGASNDVTLTIVRDRKEQTLKATFTTRRPGARTTI